MSIWEELDNLKKRIPKDTKIYQVHVRFDNYIGEHRVYIDQIDWENRYLGLIDAPINHSMGGYYSTKAKAIEAVKERAKKFSRPINWMGHLTK